MEIVLENTNEPILCWNAVAMEVHRRDFTPQKKDGTFYKIGEKIPANTKPKAPEQRGPTATSRAFAIAHLAMYDAWFAVRRAKGLSTKIAYLSTLAIPSIQTSEKSAMASAAATTLKALYKNQAQEIEQALNNYIKLLHTAGETSHDTNNGLIFGKEVGDKYLMNRYNDNSNKAGSYVYLNIEGAHQADPFSPGQTALGAFWGDVKPFGISNAQNIINGFTHPLGKATIGEYVNSPQWAAELNEVKAKGVAKSDNTSTRKPEETLIGTFWGYDGVSHLGTPPRLYNQCVSAISVQQNLNTDQNAQLFALVNMLMADAGIFAWKEKYTYHVARPVVAVREAGKSFGNPPMPSSPTFTAFAMPQANTTYAQAANWLNSNPTAPSTVAGAIETVPCWAPLGAPQTNQNGSFNKTPNFPAYPSGHATFGSVCFHAVAAFLKKIYPTFNPANFVFDFVSDEYNGISQDPDGSVRVKHTRGLTLAQAIHENAVSRVYLGVHYRMDAVEGVRLGQHILSEALASGQGPAKF